MKPRSRKTKHATRQSIPTPNELEEVTKRIVKLVSWINQTCTDPVNWLMTDKERISFIRELYYTSKQIEQSEGFALLQLQSACLSFSSGTSPCGIAAAHKK